MAVPPERAILHIEKGQVRDIEQATLVLQIFTEAFVQGSPSLFGRSNSSWLYGPAYSHAEWRLELLVDEHSGEDAMLSPSLSMHIDGAVLPTRLEETTGMELIEEEGCRTEAWYGNDAPQLKRNRLRFGKWERNRVWVSWTAEYDWGLRYPELIPFAFEGPVAFGGINMMVKEEQDASSLLSHVLPSLDQAALTLVWGRAINYGASVSPDRRYWREATWHRVVDL